VDKDKRKTRMDNKALRYSIALTLVPGIGTVIGKKLINVCGSAEIVFTRSQDILKPFPRIFHLIRNAGSDKEIWKRADEEIRFIEKYRLKVLCFGEEDYPVRLAQCYDAPVLLFYKGIADLNAGRIIGIVGTRNASDYGKNITMELIKGMRNEDPLVISGLACGIDSYAHRIALECGLNTVGVLGHGLDRIYPFTNQKLAEKMIRQGGLLTEFFSSTKPDRENFPQRNRIIAGLCDAIIVIEAAEQGGALITANIANSYDREVFAVPGRIGDKYSEGCNVLINKNLAVLVLNAEEILEAMRWKEPKQKPGRSQPRLFISLTPDEEKIVELLNKEGDLSIDEIGRKSALTINKVSAALLNLELENVVRCKPGKIFSLSH
jgi:DNA processing protein